MLTFQNICICGSDKEGDSECFVDTKSMLAKINPISPELNTLAILSG